MPRDRALWISEGSMLYRVGGTELKGLSLKDCGLMWGMETKPLVEE